MPTDITSTKANAEARIFAVVPAAGHSRRMGRPKLLLPLGTGTVISRLLAVLQRPEITETVVVVRSNDDDLQREVQRSGGRTVRPTVDPQDMRQSVEAALQDLRTREAPTASDAWILSPADHPMLAAGIVDRLLDRWRVGDCQILVPQYAGRRGHPTLFSWSLVDEVFQIPADCGLNHLVAEHQREVVEFPVTDEAVVTDLNTPADYESLLRRWRQGSLPDGARGA